MLPRPVAGEFRHVRDRRYKRQQKKRRIEMKKIILTTLLAGMFISAVAVQVQAAPYYYLDTGLNTEAGSAAVAFSFSGDMIISTSASSSARVD